MPIFSRSLHYGWVVVFAGLLCLFVSIGLGRMALGMLLPSMGKDIALSYAQMGFIGTGNFAGYMIGVLLIGPFCRLVGERRAISLGLLVISLTMLAVGQAGGFVSVMVAYLATGVGSGTSMVATLGLVGHWFSRRLRGKAAGWIITGIGVGVVFSGIAVPWINAELGAEGWRMGWMLLGGASLAATALVYGLLRERPSELGLEPVGAAVAFDEAESEGIQVAPSRGEELRLLAHLGFIYFLFGLTYVIYATFIVTTLVEERGYSEALAGRFWIWLGVISLVSGPLFGSLSDRFGRRAGLMMVFALQTAAYGMAAFDLGGVAMAVSAGLFGITAWSVPPIMAAATGDYMGPERAVTALGALTFIFGIGQVIGPAAAGMLAEHYGGFSSSYLLAATGTALAVAATAALKRQPAH